MPLSNFIEKVFTTDQGKPFRFTGRKYLIPIYNVNWKNLVIMSSRQAEKTTYIAKRIGAQLFMTPGDRILYATASHNHRKMFARDKWQEQFSNNPSLADQYLSSKLTNNTLETQLTNRSILFMRAIDRSPGSVRGLTARQIFFDEFQDIDDKSIPIAIETTQSYADEAALSFLGTPLTPGNALSVRYANSYQFEWIIRCHRCGKDNPPLGINHIDTNKPFLFCIYCGKKMNAENGLWVRQNPDGKYPGFRISRLMTPTCRWRTESRTGVLDKYDGENAYPYYQFVNEVLGLPEGVGKVPISEGVLYANCEDYDWIDPFHPPAWVHGIPVFGTIDWAWSSKDFGESYTIYALWTFDERRRKCLYAKRQVGPAYNDPDVGLNEMATVFARTGAVGVATDFGVGHKENIRLRALLQGTGCIVTEIMYAGSYPAPVFNEQDRRYHVGKTESLDLTFSALISKGFMFPSVAISKLFLKDILNVYKEHNPNTKRTRYEHAAAGPDDFLHLCNYARMLIDRHFT